MPMLELEVFTFNPFAENTYILFNDQKEALIIDPGCYEAFEKTRLVNFIEKNSLKPVGLYNTHCHVDHVLGNAFVKEKYGLKLGIHEKDDPTLKAVEVMAPAFGINDYHSATPDFFISEEDKITIGSEVLEVLFVPGHAPGHVVFIHRSSGMIIGGDVLFKESIGRTDLPGGNHEQLLKNIRKKMYKLPDHFRVYPGHGPMTTIGHEKIYNPFVRFDG